jgi:hypothetical protein
VIKMVSNEKDGYEKRLRFTRAFVHGFERSKQMPKPFFSKEKKSGLQFLQHLWEAFSDLQGDSLNNFLENLTDSLPHTASVVKKIARTHTLPFDQRLNLSEKPNELADYWRWLSDVDDTSSNNVDRWIENHPLPIAAWILLFLGQQWWEDFKKALDAKPFIAATNKVSVHLMLQVASKKEPRLGEQQLQKIADHELMKKLRTRLEVIYKRTIACLEAKIATLAINTPTPSLEQTAIRRVYLEYQFWQPESREMSKNPKAAAAWFTESLTQLSQSQKPSPAPQEARENGLDWLIKTIQEQLEQHQNLPLSKRQGNTANLLNQNEPDLPHLEFAMQLDKAIAELQPEEEAINHLLSFYDQNTGHRYTDTLVLAAAQDQITLAEMFGQILDGWRKLVQRLEQPAGDGWYSELTALLLELEEGELEEILRG